jgi:8-oxo-dGTP pyrophosphatase MutT (NUDIX family)
MAMPRKYYCVGFVYSLDGTMVALQLKGHPPAQAGWFNGAGGEIDAAHGEHPAAAMAREFVEETGTQLRGGPWERFLDVSVGDGISMHTVLMFHRVFVPGEELARVVDSASDKAEPLRLCEVSRLPSHVLPDLKWIVPLGARRDYQSPINVVQVREVASNG